MPSLACPVCHYEMERHVVDWLLRCGSCGFQASTLEPRINGDDRDGLDEAVRADALATVRRRNFETVLDVLDANGAGGGALLDVGCAHGWLLQMAAGRGYEAIGIEPDRSIAQRTRARGLDVIEGFFPADVPDGRQFDVVSFNDTIEHIPQPDRVVLDAGRLLRPGGLLVINIPLSSGVFYRLASLLARVGIGGPLDRMWQVGFPSPHVSYFTVRHIERLGARAGFESVTARRLRTLSVRGLWARLRYADSPSLPGRCVVYIGTLLMTPVIRLLPPDIGLVVMRKAHSTGG